MATGKDPDNRYFLSSLTRITDFARKRFDVEALERSRWRHGDYVAAQVRGRPSRLYRIELPDGRMVNMMDGDLVVGAFGKRAATLEGVGDWEAIGDDGRMHALTGAGLFGMKTSTSPLIPRLMSLQYQGHVIRNGVRQNMDDFVSPVAAEPFDVPVILMVGTSMSAGKSTAGRVIIHELSLQGFRVCGAKFTGAGRYQDILGYGDAGAVAIVDFVDAGLPSTVVPEARFDAAMKHMMARIAAEKLDVAVIEAGASPLEPYNGALCIEALAAHIRFVVLCAWDPYSVVGVKTAFDLRADLVTGPATNTSAGIELVEKLTGVPALNLLDRASLPRLRELLNKALAT